MAKTAMVNARIEPKLKKETEAIFRRLGLTTAQALALFFALVRNYRGLPFEIRIPNRATRRAIRNARVGVGVKTFRSVEEMMEELEH